ncbi:mannose-1-phosphate guanylyltransferase [Candidatus Methylomirabilis limnetica]|uniref:Mannose-1-phosphate guanylyltransferase n=2 Tax=Candidatus Methylomirabilis limnetica TaxID=2033718 RepID=A0A2T4TVV4_9BACT|nr:mannose-1-phosphate guanylyltransferase [Candidatus Methylomirabilis limnetica]PTL35243.1 mannose-1-phosphate guanylyltransferase [Candidatus Methylomirabilis limnetica]
MTLFDSRMTTGGATSSNPHVFAVVLAGGKGERFWPLSTEAQPKAFLRLIGSESLLQATVRRVRLLLPWVQIVVVVEQKHGDLVREQLPELPVANLLLEPQGMDTAAAIGIASLHLERLDPEAVMIALPADHYVPDGEAFAAGVRRATELLASYSDWVVMFGIPPARPETGYGYLEVGEPLASPPGAFRVRRFLEKPDRQTAERLATDGYHYWNSGIFLWRNVAIQSLLARHMPEVWAGLCRIREAWGVQEALEREYSAFKKQSVDYGVLERMGEGVAMVRADFAWDDLGTWDALARVLPVDDDGNVIVGEVHLLDTTQSVIVSTGPRVATVGLSEMIVVASKDGVLVCPKERAQEVRKLAGGPR